MLHEELTKSIMRAYYRVYNTLGYGFLEKVYENALEIELTKQGHSVSRQTPIEVYYDGEFVGDCFADIVVDGSVILELKAAVTLCEDHRLQLVNYLRATDKEVGLLLNFGRQPEFKRALFSNDRKIALKGQDHSSANHRIPQIRENPSDPYNPCSNSEVSPHG